MQKREWKYRLMSEPPGEREGREVVGGSQVDAGLKRVGRRVMFTEATGPGRSNTVRAEQGGGIL
jgi:hypothetical protein